MCTVKEHPDWQPPVPAPAPVTNESGNQTNVTKVPLT